MCSKMQNIPLRISPMRLLVFAIILCLYTSSFVVCSSPNIIFILTDDQDITLGGMEPMEKTQKLIGNYGAVFENAFATTPICCPSRSSILTGKYLHNHNAVNNSLSGGCSSKSWQEEQETHSYSVYLKRGGYTTFYAGKYLNQYGHASAGGVEHVPPGWDWWIGLVGNSRYYDYTLSVNGTAEKHGSNYEEDYLTDIIKRYGLEFLNQKVVEDGPFFMTLAVPTPHAPFTPAPQYKDYFINVTAPRTPNYNIAVGEDKHWLLRMPPSTLNESTLAELDRIYRSRWEALLSVDDLVYEIIDKVDLMGQLNNTYIIFSSDHGFHVGQFALPWDKRQPYEFDIRIPLLVRGPGINPKQVISEITLNIDFAPTFIEMANLEVATIMDGESFLPLLTGQHKIAKKSYSRKLALLEKRHKVTSTAGTWREAFLIEYRGEGKDGTVSPDCPWGKDGTLAECVPAAACKCEDSKNNTYNCVRELSTTENTLYCQFYDAENFVEAYNLNSDPYQLHNVEKSLQKNLINKYKIAMNYLQDCHGRFCHKI